MLTRPPDRNRPVSGPVADRRRRSTLGEGEMAKRPSDPVPDEKIRSSSLVGSRHLPGPRKSVRGSPTVDGELVMSPKDPAALGDLRLW